MQNTHTHTLAQFKGNKQRKWLKWFTARKQKQNINKPHQPKAHWDARKRSHEALNNNNARWSRHNRMRWKTVPKCNEIPIPPTVGMEQKGRRAPFTLEGFSLSLAVISVACSLSVCMWDFSRPFPFHRWASGGAACEREKERDRGGGEKNGKHRSETDSTVLLRAQPCKKIVALWEKKSKFGFTWRKSRFRWSCKKVFFFFVM